jgi:uncharacterized protein YgiM (DUF1202 family)
MKKYLWLLLMILPALACYQTSGAIKPAAATVTATDAPIITATDAPKPLQLATPETAMLQQCTVTALDTLNLRKAPGTDAEVIGILHHDDLVTILDTSPQDHWIQVRTRDRDGWINSRFCE